MRRCVETRCGGSLKHAQLFFFFEQETAYEIRSGLGGSEMCIGESSGGVYFRVGLTLGVCTFVSGSLCGGLHSFLADFAASYTNLTLPTNRVVLIWVGVEGRQKKQ